MWVRAKGSGVVISTAYHFIFIHAPKTGGNSIQLLLEPFSDDRRFVGPGQDGRERFGLRGPVTPGKHASLADYRRLLGDRLRSFQIIVGVRDPLERAVSFYYSPHRWARKAETDGQPTFQRDRFERVLKRLPSVAALLTIDGETRLSDHILRTESLSTDLATLARALGLPRLAPLPHVNASAADRTQREATLADGWVRRLVTRRYADDYDLFGCARP